MSSSDSVTFIVVPAAPTVPVPPTPGTVPPPPFQFASVETYRSPVPYRVIGALAILVAAVALAIFVIAFIPPAAAIIIPVAVPLLATKIGSGVVALFFAALGTGLLVAAPKNEGMEEGSGEEEEVENILTPKKTKSKGDQNDGDVFPFSPETYNAAGL